MHRRARRALGATDMLCMNEECRTWISHVTRRCMPRALGATYMTANLLCLWGMLHISESRHTQTDARIKTWALLTWHDNAIQLKTDENKIGKMMMSWSWHCEYATFRMWAEIAREQCVQRDGLRAILGASTSKVVRKRSRGVILGWREAVYQERLLVFRYAAVCSSVLQCVARCCSALQCAVVCRMPCFCSPFWYAYMGWLRLVGSLKL